MGAVQLVHAVLHGIALLVQGPEDVLGYLCLLLSSSSTKLVKADVEPLIDLLVQLVGLVADLARGDPLLLHELGLSGGAVLVRAADVEHVVPPQPRKPSEHICTENTAHYDAQVGDVVHVRQGRGGGRGRTCLGWLLLSVSGPLD